MDGLSWFQAAMKGLMATYWACGVLKPVGAWHDEAYNKFLRSLHGSGRPCFESVPLDGPAIWSACIGCRFDRFSGFDWTGLQIGSMTSPKKDKHGPK